MSEKKLKIKNEEKDGDCDTAEENFNKDEEEAYRDYEYW